MLTKQVLTTTFLKRRIIIPVAPTAEEDRIVAKVEELFSFLDAGIASLESSGANK